MGAAIAAGPAYPASLDTGNRDRHMGISLANIEEIRVNQYQPRRDFDEAALEELAQSIRTSGIIQPLLVRKEANGEIQLIAGERRLRAAKRAGLKQVPIVIRKSTDREALELALVENIQRQNLNCIDEALAYFQLTQDFSLTQEEVAARVGKERATVANHLRLLRLPEAIIDDLRRQILSLGHGKVLLGIEDNEARLRVRAEIVEKHLSVRDAEALVNLIKAGNAAAEGAATKNTTEPTTPLKERFRALAQELTRHWSARVEIKGSERRGKITLHYGSRQELDRLLEAMHNK
ncbi:MAG: ParB/RepB/Spo0J family partition protein [Oligoflexia bacterium]|nr:ParB/RepB/Spo0J family partition protein [Oligoflexia bacterium]